MGSIVQSIWDSVAGRDMESPEVKENANQFVAWASKPYHQVFLDWLYDQADAPIDTRSDHAGLIASSARSNTFKEIRRYLYDQESRARSVLDREHG